MRVAGCFGVKSVQQSASGSMEISNVPSRCASPVISSLSMPMSGLRIGSDAAASMAAMLSSVCEATCPRLSPVVSASAPARRPIVSAMRTIRRR
jgi:hypothetical protein